MASSENTGNFNNWSIFMSIGTRFGNKYACQPLCQNNSRKLRLAHLARWIWIRRKRQTKHTKKGIPPRTEQSNKPTKKMSYLRQKKSEITALKIDVEYTHRVKIYMENKFCRWIHIAPYNVCGQFHFKFKLALENFHLAVLCDNKYNPIYTILIKCKFKCVKRL